MKAVYHLLTVPQSGVRVTIEGMLVRLLFDITPATLVIQEGEEAPTDLYDCESVDAVGRGHDDIVSAIINDRYPSDKVQAVMANFANAQDQNSDLTQAKREEYLAEYAAYQAWRAHAKQIATIAVSLIQQ